MSKLRDGLTSEVNSDTDIDYVTPKGSTFFQERVSPPPRCLIVSRTISRGIFHLVCLRPIHFGVCSTFSGAQHLSAQ